MQFDSVELTKNQKIGIALGLPVFFAMVAYGFYLLLSPWQLTWVQIVQCIVILFISGTILGTLPFWLPKILIDIGLLPDDEEEDDE
jgi:Mg/Co/Ni transporter MgtE